MGRRVTFDGVAEEELFTVPAGTFGEFEPEPHVATRPDRNFFFDRVQLPALLVRQKQEFAGSEFVVGHGYCV
jgi:hypothetical protein